MLMFIMWLAIVGFIAGLLARAILPGDDAMGILGTIFLGLVGSVVGGFLVASSSGRRGTTTCPHPSASSARWSAPSSC